MPETILLTGASGFMAKHVLRQMLEAGHRIRAAIRTPARADEVRHAVLSGLPPDAAERLGFVTLDLTSDAGWSAAAEGVTALVHTASPFPIAQPKNADDLIRPAVEGTRRALHAARYAGIARVILTSSSVAVAPVAPQARLDETDWSDPDDPRATAYQRSKTLAERAAWTFARENPGLAMTVINPALVLGPPLDRTFGSSVGLVRRILSGRDPLVPALGFGVVDVRDVALAHLRALERPGTAGKRYLVVAGSMWMADMARVLRKSYPARRIATRVAPTVVMRLLALADPEVRAILPGLGHIETYANDRARADLGIDFIPPETALKATAAFLVDQRLV